MYSSFKVYAGTLRPTSRGYVNLKSLDPYEHPVINPKYLSTEQDRVELREAVRLARDIFNQKAFAPFRGEELQPDIVFALQRLTFSCSRPVSSCLLVLCQNKLPCETIHIMSPSAHSFIFMQVKITLI